MARSGPPKQMLSTKQAACHMGVGEGCESKTGRCMATAVGVVNCLGPLSLVGLRPWQEAVIATHTILCRLLSGNCKQRSNDEFGQNDYTLAATAAASGGGVRRLPGSPGRRGNSTQLSSFCDLCVRLIRCSTICISIWSF